MTMVVVVVVGLLMKSTTVPGWPRLFACLLQFDLYPVAAAL